MKGQHVLTLIVFDTDQSGVQQIHLSDDVDALKSKADEIAKAISNDPANRVDWTSTPYSAGDAYQGDDQETLNLYWIYPALSV